MHKYLDWALWGYFLTAAVGQMRDRKGKRPLFLVDKRERDLFGKALINFGALYGFLVARIGAGDDRSRWPNL